MVELAVAALSAGIEIERKVNRSGIEVEWKGHGREMNSKLYWNRLK